MNIGLHKQATLVRCPQVDDQVFIVWVDRDAICWEALATFSRSRPRLAMTSELIKLSDCVSVSRIEADCRKPVLSCSLLAACELLADLKDPAIVV